MTSHPSPGSAHPELPLPSSPGQPNDDHLLDLLTWFTASVPALERAKEARRHATLIAIDCARRPHTPESNRTWLTVAARTRMITAARCLAHHDHRLLALLITDTSEEAAATVTRLRRALDQCTTTAHRPDATYDHESTVDTDEVCEPVMATATCGPGRIATYRLPRLLHEVDVNLLYLQTTGRPHDDPFTNPAHEQRTNGVTVVPRSGIHSEQFRSPYEPTSSTPRIRPSRQNPTPTAGHWRSVSAHGG